MLIRMDALTHMGSMMGMQGPFAGFIVHLICSIILGVVFAIIFHGLCHSLFTCAIWGVIYGIILWFIFHMIFFQGYMDKEMMVTHCDKMRHSYPMLFGYLVFGLSLGVSYYWFRTSQHRQTK
jgi:uncharacterized membrane protein YagU involved in acid resistance